MRRYLDLKTIPKTSQNAFWGGKFGRLGKDPGTWTNQDDSWFMSLFRTGLVWRKGLALAKDMLDRCQNPGWCLVRCRKGGHVFFFQGAIFWNLKSPWTTIWFRICLEHFPSIKQSQIQVNWFRAMSWGSIWPEGLRRFFVVLFPKGNTFEVV